MTNLTSHLQLNPLFAGIAEENLNALLNCLHPPLKRYAKNQFVLLEGDPTDRFGLVISGKVQILKEDYFGTRNIIASVGPNELFGEAFSAAELDAYPLSVIAAEESEILLFNMKQLLTTCERSCAYHHRLIRNMVRILGRKNVGLLTKIDHVSQRSTRDKVLSYLSSVAKETGSNQFTIPFNRQELADYLCAERSALSAVISKLQEEGVLTFNRNRFTLHSKKD